MEDSAWIELRCSTKDEERFALLQRYLTQLLRLDILWIISHGESYILVLDGGDEYACACLAAHAIQLRMWGVSTRMVGEDEQLEIKVALASQRSFLAVSGLRFSQL